jgi:NAD(P)-dependent dehydrogenase (short-subunit alcohol dehydrogenase family)
MADIRFYENTWQGKLGVRLAGKVAFVTGGGRGIGRATALEMAREGARVYAADLPEVANTKTTEETSVVTLSGDISHSDEVDSMIETALSFSGRLDILVNNAGVFLSKPFEEVSHEDWAALIRVNLEAVFFVSQRAAKPMKEGGGGAIVNIASTSAFVSSAGQSVYETSKGGVAMLTRSLAVELAPCGIRVNAVAPGLIETDMTRSLFGSEEKMLARVEEKAPLKRPGKPEDIARAVVFLASDDAAYVVGQTLVVDGGWLLP